MDRRHEMANTGEKIKTAKQSVTQTDHKGIKQDQAGKNIARPK